MKSYRSSSTFVTVDLLNLFSGLADTKVHQNNGCRFEFVGVDGGPVLL